MKIRCYEYNWACAKMKKDAPKFTKPDSNAWRLVPDTEIHYSDKAAAAGKQAMDLLKKVVAEHPNTPWALLAQRELKDPLGFKWVETHVPPVPQATTTPTPRPRRSQTKQSAQAARPRPSSEPGAGPSGTRRPSRRGFAGPPGGS